MMVDTHQIPPASPSILYSPAESLQQLANHNITSQRLVQLAEEFYWALIEGQYRSDRIPAANRLRDTLSDISAQWEILQGNLHD
jgi:hypothetical protein